MPHKHKKYVNNCRWLNLKPFTLKMPQYDNPAHHARQQIAGYFWP
jgi:hypothetical protein